ncbi:hypothetical protein niasHT_006790 [Heterodera trifolii]|uniref:BED-type domain-containing protein n=1 Tax=Heterodera trifolii TaxID=157864 RepID=A0ABD2M6U1_9BILA
MLIDKNRLRSAFWRVGFFKRISRDVAKCLLCHQKISTTNGNTTGLKNHLKRRHADYEHFVERVKEEPNVWLNGANGFPLANGSDGKDSSQFVAGCESSSVKQTVTADCYIGTAYTEQELATLCHENCLRAPPNGTIEGLKRVHLVCSYNSRPWLCPCLAEWVADTGALYMRGEHNEHPTEAKPTGEEEEEEKAENNGNGKEQKERHRRGERERKRTLKKERSSSREDEEQTEGQCTEERARGRGEKNRRQNYGVKKERVKKERNESTADNEQMGQHNDQQRNASSVVTLEHSQQQQQQHFVDRKGNRWDFVASAFRFHEMVAAAAALGFVRTGWNPKYKRWWFKCKANSKHLKCLCRATWLSSQNSLFQHGTHNHPIKIDTENTTPIARSLAPKTFSVSLSERRFAPHSSAVRPLFNNGTSFSSSVTSQIYPPQFLKAHNGPCWQLSAVLPPSFSEKVIAEMALPLRFVNEKNVGRAYYKCTNSKCITTGVFLRSIRAFYTRGKHSCQQSHLNDSRAKQMVKTTKPSHLKKSRKRPKPLTETQATSSLASSSSTISSTSAHKQPFDCVDEVRANGTLPTHSGRTLLRIDEDGNCVEIPMQRKPTSPVKKNCLDIGKPENEMQQVNGGQWEFVQRITNESQIYFYINRFNLVFGSSSKATGGRRYFNCFERGGSTKCPYRMMYMLERQALYQTGEHNHSFSLSRRRKPTKINIKGLLPTPEKGGDFELLSLATDVAQLAEELGLEFREERGRFVLISNSDECDKENCPSTSTAIPQNEVVKWLVLADKKSTIRCSEYSRKTPGEPVEGCKENWKKWGRVQFLRAIRSKCGDYFGEKTNSA